MAQETEEDVQIRHVMFDEREVSSRVPEILDLFAEASHAPFQLGSEPPFRALIARASSMEVAVEIVIHHIACDGWSVKVLWDEIAAILGDVRKGNESSLPALEAKYADFVDSESSEASRSRRDRDVDWAVERLQGDLASLSFPFPATANSSTRMTLEGTLPPHERARLAAQAANALSPAGSPYLAAFLSALQSESGRDDIPIVIPASGRLDPKFSDLVGYFVKPVVVAPNERAGQGGPEDLLRSAAERIFDAEEHQGATVEGILDRVPQVHTRPADEMAQIAFQYMGPAFHTVRTTDGIEARPLRLITGNDPFALELCVHDDGDRSVLLLLFDTGRLHEHTARSILDQVLDHLNVSASAPARTDVVTSRHRHMPDGPSLAPTAQDMGVGVHGADLGADARLALTLSAFASVLDIADPDPDTDFFSAGGHSLALVDLITTLSASSGTTLDLRAVLQDSTPRGVSAMISPDVGRSLSVITRSAEEVGPVLAPNQRRLWALQLLDPTSTEYNSTQAFTLEGQLDVDLLAKAVSLVVQKYDVLRTAIPADHYGRPAPRASTHEPGLVVLDDEPASAPQDAVAVREASLPFAVDEQAPARFVLARRNDQTWSFVITVHHLASDAFSNRIIATEIGEAYSALMTGSITSSRSPLRFADYAQWKLSAAEEERDRESLEFWIRELKDFREVSSLATLHEPTFGPSPSRAIRFDIDVETSARVDELSRELGITRFALLFGAHQITMAGLLGRDLVVTGVVSSGRYLPELSDVVGFFANLLPVPTRLHAVRPVRDALRDVHATLVSCYQHETVNYESIVERARPQRHPGSDPLVRNTFQLIEVPDGPPLILPGVKTHELFVPSTQTPFELAIDLFVSEGRLNGVLEYDEFAFGHDDAAAVVSAFLSVLTCITSDDGRHTIADVWADACATGGFVQATTNEARGTDSPARDVIAQFDAIAAKLPSDIALVDETSQWTFGETLSAIDAVAVAVGGCGLQPGSRVGLLTSRTRWFVAAAFGAMKAGMTVVLLDNADPLARSTAITRAAEMRLILSDERTQPEAQFLGPTLLVGNHLLSATTAQTPSRVDLDEAAYVVFTSGTTGMPKGVAVGHAALANLVASHSQNHHPRAMARAGRSLRVAHMVSMAFDLSWDAFAWMLDGNTVVILSDEVRRDTARLIKYLDASRIDVVECTPSQLEQMIAAGYLSASAWEPTLVAVGGEAVSPALWSRLAQSKPLAYNFYGPSEFTVDALVAEISGDQPVVGWPGDNCYVRLLDDQGLEVEHGQIGEICLGGAQVSWGYVNSARLTAERFVPDAHALTAGARLYRSGDFGRMTAAGVEYLGRRDGQIKLAGLRVELGEIETTLSNLAGVSQAVALPVYVAGDVVRVAAFVTAHSPVATDDLRQQAASRLPRHMVPSSFTIVPAIPLKSSGKIDERALLDRESAPRPFGDTEGDRENDSSIAEARVVRDIMGDVLGMKDIALADDFFLLGGHSLTAIQVMTRVNARLGTNLSLSSIFDSPTALELAARVTSYGSRPGSTAPEGPAEPEEISLLLSPGQQRLWLLQSEVPADASYNMTEAFELVGPVDVERLIAAVERVLSRHAELFGRIDDSGPAPVQIVPERPRAHVTYDEWDDTSTADVEDKLTALLEHVSSTPYDLSRGDLFRAHIARATHGNAYLILGFHHMVADGWSVSVLLAEVSRRYNGDDSRGTLRQKHNETIADDGRDTNRSMGYWVGEVTGASQNVRLGVEQGRARESSAGSRITVDIDDQLVRAIDALAARTRTTAYMATLSAFQIAVARWSSDNTILIGMPVAGRTTSGEDSNIGFYVNTLAIRHDHDESDTYLDVLGRTRRRVVDGLANQGVPFDALVREIAPERRLSTNPLIQVTYQLFEQDIDGALSLEGVTARPLNVFNDTARFDLSLDLFRRKSGLGGWLYFATDVYDEDLAHRFAESFVHVLRQVVVDESVQLAALTLVEPPHETGESTPIELVKPVGPPVLDRWARTVASNPRGAAVVDVHGTVDFSAMDELVSTFSARLDESEFRPGDIVALGMPRDRTGLALLLAAWQTGLVAVPLDQSVPEARTSLVLAASKAVAVVTACYSPADGQGRLSVRHLAEREPSGGAVGAAYIILTSGSTGVPKPVIVPHTSLTNLLDAHETSLMRAHPAAVRVLHSASFGFDVAMDHLVWLIAGRQLHIMSDETRRDMEAFATYITAQGIEVVNVTPSVATQLRPSHSLENPNLCVLIVGGEDVTETLWSYLAGLPASVYNFYGPTEATVDTTTHRLRVGDRRQLGSSIAGSYLRLLDALGRAVPNGVAGEICIGGEGLAWGYWGDSSATAERFIPDASSVVPGARLYRSGDLAYRRSSGELSYLGRLDRQVKLRGHRIELGEVETALEAAGLAGASVHLVDTDSGHVLAAHAPWSGNETAFQTAVENWRDVFVETHNQAAHAERGAEHGWVDSVTGSVIGRDDMEEWAACTVTRIVALSPRHLFELGAGTGLIMDRLLRSWRLASYTGSDLSAAALPFLEQISRRYPDVDCRLFEAEAMDAAEAITPDVDTVVINSVTQYFPSLRHVEALVSRIVDRLADGATLFVGDVRNPHVERCARARIDATNYDAGKDPELSVDTRFWEHLLAVVPRISGIEIAPRMGAALNEMTRYRYDVVIHVARDNRTPVVEWIEESPAELASIEQVLGSRRIPVGWRAVGNARTRPGPGSWNPHDLFLLAQRHGWSFQVSWSGHDPLGHFDALFLPEGHRATLANGIIAPVVTRAHIADYEIEFVLPPRTEKSLTRSVLDRMRLSVPSALVPASLTFLLRLPLTANGKIDSAALARRHEHASAAESLPPENGDDGVAQRVASVFSKVTSHQLIGLDDDFFKVGGDSLSAAMAARDLRNLGLDVSIRMVLAGRTPAMIARLLKEAHEAIS